MNRFWIDILNSILRWLTSGTSTPRLPEAAFLVGTYFFPQVNVELVISIRGHGYLYAWREDNFGNVGWHLLGGIVRPRERVRDRIVKTLQTECSILSHYEISERLVGYSEVMAEEKAIRSHFISLVFRIDLEVEAECIEELNGSNKEYLITDDIPEDLISNHERYRVLLKSEGAEMERY